MEKILRILKENNIDYKESGKNIGKGTIAGINCPFCGDDTGYHLGILKGKNDYYYTCWKNKKHQGTFEYLLSKLVGISIQEAKSIVYDDFVIEDDKLLEQLKLLDEPEVIKTRKIGGVDILSFDEDFKDIENKGMYKIFYDYLKRRGFEDVDELVKKYQLKCSLIGEWKYRVVFPYFMDDKLVSWTGRIISDDKYTIRYKDLEIDKSVRHTNFCLYNWDSIKEGGKILFLTEGQFDALKMDFYSGYKATCIGTTSMTAEQIILLNQISDNYKRIYLLLDRGAEVQAMELLNKLSFIKNTFLLSMPDYADDDPGKMTKDEILYFMGAL